jgi:hypothetical protein
VTTNLSLVCFTFVKKFRSLRDVPILLNSGSLMLSFRAERQRTVDLTCCYSLIKYLMMWNLTSAASVQLHGVVRKHRTSSACSALIENVVNRHWIFYCFPQGICMS